MDETQIAEWTEGTERLRMVERVTVNPLIALDWSQVKGSQKSKAAEHKENDAAIRSRINIGAIQVWDGRSGLSVMFEVLECIQDTPETRSIVAELIGESFHTLRKKGISGLIAKAAASDRSAAIANKLVTALNSQGADINPLSIPWIERTLNSSLQRMLYKIAQGMGMKFPIRVTVLDAGLKPGTCVCSGIKPGSDLAMFRTPIVLSQGLTTCKVVEPEARHLVKGRVPINTIYLHPFDLTGRMQGDDDGDTVGVSTDPRILRLWQNLVDHRKFAIEPVGEKMVIPTTGDDLKPALDYMAVDGRGAVGLFTNFRSQLLAIGDVMGALAMSVLIQESIDQAKRIVNFTDWTCACQMEYWEWKADVDSYCYVGPKIGTTLPQKEVGDWLKDRLLQFDVPEGSNILGWSRKEKRIDPRLWRPLEEDPTSIRGNLCHFAHDYAWALWQDIEKEFHQHGRQVDIRNLAYEIASKRFPDLKPPQSITFQDLQRYYRDPYGIRKFGLSRHKAYDTPGKEERFEQMERAIAELHQHIRNLYAQNPTKVLTDLCQIWYSEIEHDTPEDNTKSQDEDEATSEFRKKKGNTNNGFYSIIWPGSPFLEILDIKMDDECPHLTPTRMALLMARLMASEDPHQAMEEAISKNTTHQDELGVPAIACQACCKNIALGLVSELRKRADLNKTEELGRLISRLNKTNYVSGPTLVIETDYDGEDGED